MSKCKLLKVDVCLIKLGLQAQYMHVEDIYICKKTQQKVAIYGQKITI